MNPRLTPHDLLAACAPTLGSVLGSFTIAQLSDAAQLVGALLGGAYLLWKWLREARAPLATPSLAKANP